jgi:hypothetical protein
MRGAAVESAALRPAHDVRPFQALDEIAADVVGEMLAKALRTEPPTRTHDIRMRLEDLHTGAFSAKLTLRRFRGFHEIR